MVHRTELSALAPRARRAALSIEGADAARARADLAAWRAPLEDGIEAALDADPETCASWFVGLDAALDAAGAHDLHVGALAAAADRLRDEAPERALYLDYRRGRALFLRGRTEAAHALVAPLVDHPALSGDDGRPSAAWTAWPVSTAVLRWELSTVHSAVLRHLGDGAAALSCALRMVREAERLGDRRGLLRGWFHRAAALQARGRHAAAASAYETALAHAAALGADRLRALILANLGMGARAQGRPVEALAWFDAALDALLAVGDELLAGKVLADSAAVAMDLGHLEEAGRLLDVAEPWAAAQADAETQVVLQMLRARWRLVRGDPAGAHVDLVQASATATGLGMRALAARIPALRASLPRPDAVELRRAPGGYDAVRGRVRQPIRLARRPGLARILEALVTAAGAPVSAEALIAAGWPGEVLLEGSGRTRLYTAIRTLRGFGLGDALVRTDGGYALTCRLR